MTTLNLENPKLLFRAMAIIFLLVFVVYFGDIGHKYVPENFDKIISLSLVTVVFLTRFFLPKTSVLKFILGMLLVGGLAVIAGSAQSIFWLTVLVILALFFTDAIATVLQEVFSSFHN